MSKSLELFKKLREAFVLVANKEFTEELDNIEEELKSLEIIKKCVSFNSLGDLIITNYGKSHYDLLKEVLQ